MRASLDCFQHFFQLGKRNVYSHFIKVLAALQIAPKKEANVEVMANLLGIKYDTLHHFMSDSPWDPKSVIDQAAQLTYGLMKQHTAPIVLAIDETSFAKKGKHSAGVDRQYLGCVGKVDNGQVVVMSSLVQGTNASLVAAELYIPEDFHADSVLMEKVGLDAKTKPFKTKVDLALDQLDHLLSLGCRPDYIVADAGYGSSMEFREYCRYLDINYILDIKGNTRLWFQGADTAVAKRRSLASSWKSHLATGIQKSVTIRSNKAAKPTQRTVSLLPVVVLNDHTGDHVNQTLMVVEETNVETSYKLTNLPCDEQVLETIAKISAHRYYIERTFQNAKELFNMSAYQVRKYDALMKHLALAIVNGYRYNQTLYAEETQEPYMSQNKLRERFSGVLKAICVPIVDLKEALEEFFRLTEIANRNQELALQYWRDRKMPE